MQNHKCQGFILGSCLRARAAHRHRTGNAVGDAGALNSLLVGRQAHVHAAPERRDVHRVSHGVLDVVAIAVFVARLWDEDGGLDLAILHAAPF